MAQAQLFADEYKVNLDIFEGPLDLLLYLIRREELDIYDIPIGYDLAEHCNDASHDCIGDGIVVLSEIKEEIRC